MIPSIFSILAADTAVKALFGTAPAQTRIYPFGEAPQDPALPYATYTVFDGNPENTLGETPEVDVMRTQINVWSDTVSSVASGASAIRDALEGHAHMTSFSMEPPDSDTKLMGQRMDFDVFEVR